MTGGDTVAGRRGRLEAPDVLCTAVLAAVAFTVVYPAAPGRAAELPGRARPGEPAR